MEGLILDNKETQQRKNYNKPKKFERFDNIEADKEKEKREKSSSRRRSKRRRDDYYSDDDDWADY